MANYIDKKEFYEAIKEYQTTRLNSSYQKIGKFFLLIASNYLNKPSFINYTRDRKDDMISDATMMMLKKIDEFDCDLYNDPFAYFTTVAKRAIFQNFNMKKRDKETFVNLAYIDNYEIGNMIE